MIITLLNIYCKWKFTDTLHILYEVLAFKKLHVYQMIINESFQHEESYILSNISFCLLGQNGPRFDPSWV